MSALAHYLEDEGIPTTGVSLVREHTQGYRPPRFLWVSFPLGRPFGAPGEAAFQGRVLRAALGLLERDDGPVILEDFPEDAPSPAEPGNWSCPVSFPPPATGDDAVAGVLAEQQALAPWYTLGLRRRGRTLFGMSGLEVRDVVRHVGGFLTGTPACPRPELRDAGCLKLASEDLKAWYMEAALAQPGALTPEDATAWFWHQTRAGELLRAVHARLLGHPDEELRLLGERSFLPRVAQRD